MFACTEPARMRAERRVRPSLRVPRAGLSSHRSRGQALVELAIVTPVLLLLLLAAIDLGRLSYARISVANAAREGVMVAALTPTSFTSGSACNPTSNAVICAATREGPGSLVTVAPADVAMTCNPACAKIYGATVTVTATGHFRLFTPLMWVFTGGPDVTFDQAATAEVIVTPANASVPLPTPTPTPTPTPVPGPSPTPTPTPTPSACPPPFVGFTTSQQNKNKPVVFTSTSTPTSGSCAISFWRWEFGDGFTDAGAVGTTSHSYALQGHTYSVMLTVTTPSGTFSYTGSVTTK